MCCSKKPHAHVIALGIFANTLTAGLAQAEGTKHEDSVSTPAPSAPDAAAAAAAAPPLSPTPSSTSPAAPDAPPPVTAEVHVAGATTGAASETSVSHSELEMHPRSRAEDVLESVPGLFTVQHSGGAKAQQYFLRGFDADHGTDIAFSIEGIPLNAVSHAHGQGYTDLHFLIPELILAVDATKGPYSTRVGDFATAGAVNLRLLDRVPENVARFELGTDGRQRVLGIVSPDLGEKWRSVGAVELFSYDGHFVHPEDHHRFNGYARVTRVFDDSELSFTWMGYGATWNASGIIPARAVCGESDGNPPPSAYGAPCVSRFDSFDPTQGGASQRMMGAASYTLHAKDTELAATAYMIRSSLQLFLDETFFVNDPVHGDGIEQDDARTELGANVRVTRTMELAGMSLATTAGLQTRDDSIDSGLFHQEARQRLSTDVASHIDESELGAYVEEDFRPLPWVRIVAGARADRVDVAVHDTDPTAAVKASGNRGEGLLSPKAMVVLSPAPKLDFFADYGRGFHSNDARGVVGQGATLLAVATGYEVGVRARPIRPLTLSAAAFLLDVTSELVFDGDDATTNPSGPTRREGVELTARYHLNQEIFADAALTFTHARFRDDTGQGTYVPLAPPRTFAAGVGARKDVGHDVTLFGSTRIKSMADRPATQDGTLIAQGFTLMDLEAGLRWKNIEAALELLNAFDSAWREGQFAVTSRLSYEPKPVTGMSFTPGEPREIIARATLFW